MNWAKRDSASGRRGGFTAPSPSRTSAIAKAASTPAVAASFGCSQISARGLHPSKPRASLTVSKPLGQTQRKEPLVLTQAAIGSQRGNV